MRTARAVGAATAVFSALAVLLGPTQTVHAAAPGDPVVLTVRDALRSLPVQDEDRTGYERAKFRTGSTPDRDGCHTCTEVLLAETLTVPTQAPNCTLTGGAPGTRRTTTPPSPPPAAFDIDRLVPLAESWDPGASAWTSAERQVYATELDDPRAPSEELPAPTPPTGSPSRAGGT
ncbi:HNH endonuclease [Streptomyces sp. NPDC008159]|uniref:HNH endonuclease n=1 Tax=Streptomyces sp. NPDC008159 TaxID=3364817 RepID=UPI0036E39DC2